MLVLFAAGGPADTAGRLGAVPIAKLLKQQILMTIRLVRVRP